MYTFEFSPIPFAYLTSAKRHKTYTLYKILRRQELYRFFMTSSESVKIIDIHKN